MIQQSIRIPCKSITWQRDGDNVAGLDGRAPHGIDIHDIRDCGGVPDGNGRDSILRLDDIGEVNCRQKVVGVVEAAAGKGDDKVLADLEGGGGVGGGEGVGLPDLVGGGEAGEHGRGDGGEGVGRAGLVAGGEGAADAVGAGAEGGDAEEEARGEDAVVDVREGEVDGVGGEKGGGVHLEEGGHLGDLKVGVESVADQRVAGVGAGAGLDRGLGEGNARDGGRHHQKSPEDGEGDNVLHLHKERGLLLARVLGSPFFVIRFLWETGDGRGFCFCCGFRSPPLFSCLDVRAKGERSERRERERE